MNDPEQPKEPSPPPAGSEPPVPPAEPPLAAPPAGSAPPSPPPPVDPYAAPPTPYAPPPPPASAPPATPGPYGPPTSAPPSPYGPPTSAPPSPYGPPTSALPGPYGPPPGGYGPPTPYGQPAWPGPSAPAPAGSTPGGALAIVLGVSVPLLVVLVVVGLLVFPRVLNNQQATPSSSPTPSPSEDPLAAPEVGSCYFAFISPYPFNDRAEEAEQVPCDEEHMIETIAVGELADAVAPPEDFSEEARELYRECEQAAQEFLGVSWRSTYTWLVLSVPSPSAWDDGAHWYRCDLTANRGFYQTRPARTTGSLRGNATPITCLTWRATESTLLSIEHSECNAPHQGELAGVFPVPEGSGFGDRDAVRAEVETRCVDVARDFVGIRPLPLDLSLWYILPDENALDQWVLCLVAASEANRAFTASLRGVGSGPIPFA